MELISYPRFGSGRFTVEHWPAESAQYTEEAVVVYQAYRAPIGRFAAGNKYFGGELSLVTDGSRI